MSDLEYYEDSSKHGNYQFVTLDQLVNDYMMSLDPDNYTSVVPRYQVVYQIKRGLRELYYDVLKEIKAVELELSPTLNIILPPDYVNMVRISWLDEEGYLHPMAVDNNISTAVSYLQDNNFNLLFDNEGNVLEGKIEHKPEKIKNYNFCYTEYTPNKDNSKVYSNGKFKIDTSSGIIQFGSDAQGKSIVLEYISDGLYSNNESNPDENIKIHKFAESTILDYVHYQLIKNRRNVPYNEKIRARKEYFNSRRITKRRIKSLSISDILQVFKGDSKVIK